MLKLVPVYALVFALGALSAAVEAEAGQALDQALRAHCGRSTCTITNNPGGDVALFQQAAQEVMDEGKHLRIDGFCASACVVLADLARANTCITADAQMAVHKAYIIRVTGTTTVNGEAVPVGNLIRRSDPPQSADIDSWVKAHGGYPTDGVKIIPIKAAQQFWAMCK